MARINLLPWREEQRKQRQQRFFVILGLAVILAGLAMVGVHVFVNNMISYQQARNTYLQQEIQKLDKQISKIRALQSTRRQLEARIKIIEQLQASRPEFVHLFDELVRTLPRGTYLTSVAQKGGGILIDGIAQSNARVSNYMWNIDKSAWLKNPDLRVINTEKLDGERVSKFQLQVEQAHKKAGKAGGKK